MLSRPTLKLTKTLCDGEVNDNIEHQTREKKAMLEEEDE